MTGAADIGPVGWAVLVVAMAVLTFIACSAVDMTYVPSPQVRPHFSRLREKMHRRPLLRFWSLLAALGFGIIDGVRRTFVSSLLFAFSAFLTLMAVIAAIRVWNWPEGESER